ncbi:MAG: ParB/RepB/Spo0J family partition protein [Christensenellaceae bacterium]|nr:ParB/RepB/Spo0J family partition protein [Christensenellaceae bacterium]
MLKFTRTAQAADVSLETIPIDKIRPNPYQPRRYFSEEAISELAGSIRSVGLLQPISVRKSHNGTYELIAGERRLRACRSLGYSEIRALVQTDMVDQQSAMLAMIENLQRENLHFFEEAEGYQNLIREHGFTQEELARKLSKNQSTIANKLRILRLPPQIKQKILRNALTERHARALLRLHNEDAQNSLIDRIVEEGLSVKETEELVEHELTRLYGEEKDIAPNLLLMRCSYKIYLNTLKKTVSKLVSMGARAGIETQDCGDHMLISIKLAK